MAIVRHMKYICSVVSLCPLSALCVFDMYGQLAVDKSIIRMQHTVDVIQIYFTCLFMVEIVSKMYLQLTLSLSLPSHRTRRWRIDNKSYVTCHCHANKFYWNVTVFAASSCVCVCVRYVWECQWIKIVFRMASLRADFSFCPSSPRILYLFVCGKPLNSIQIWWKFSANSIEFMWSRNRFNLNCHWIIHSSHESLQCWNPLSLPVRCAVQNLCVCVLSVEYGHAVTANAPLSTIISASRRVPNPRDDLHFMLSGLPLPRTESTLYSSTGASTQ